MSKLSDQIMEDLKTAMKAKDTTRLNVLRALKSALKYAAIETVGASGELGEAEEIAVIRKQIKQRQDSVESYEKAQREDLAIKERAEIAILEAFLPQALDPAEIEKLVDEAIAETGAESKKDMGKVMKLLQEKTAGRADGKTLSQAVSKRLP